MAPRKHTVSALPRYLARMCWNSGGWIRPTGEAKELENADTYTARMGFGHEEWLFNRDWLIDGWKYGFLQPVNQSFAKVQGQTLEIFLFTIGPNSDWRYVGHIHRCEILTEEQARKALTEHRRRGWFKKMRDDVRQVHGDLSGIKSANAPLLFNLRFKLDEVEQYEDTPAIASNDRLRTMPRYCLIALRGEREEIGRTWRTRVAAARPRPTGTRFRAGQASGSMDLIQNALQNELAGILRDRYGHTAVLLEEDYVDIKLQRPKSITLIEVKSDSQPRRAIRDALGQLLDYAFVCSQRGENVSELVVVAPAEAGPQDSAYLRHLQQVRRLPIRYICFRQGTTDVEL